MAGWGTRLRPHTLTVPKPLIKIAGKSVVEHLIDEIDQSVEYPVEQLVFIIKPQFGKQIEKLLYDIGKKIKIPARLVYQDEALGTAHAVWMAKDYLKGKVFIAYADTLFKGKIEIDPDGDATVVVKQVPNPEQFGVVKLDEKQKKIVYFLEKPRTFVSNLAIVGFYYFKQAEILRDEIQYLIENDIRKSGEYQLTDALINMLEKGYVFKPATIEKWMDFGNKNAAVQTNAEILKLLSGTKRKPNDNSSQITDSQIIEPCYIGKNVLIKNARIGPFVSIEDGTVIENAQIENSIIGASVHIQNARFQNSMLGNFVKIKDLDSSLNLDLGDYSKIGY